VRTRGVSAALEALNLQALAGRSAQDVFLGLVDFVCPNGGTVDDGIAREAFIETIVELAEQGFPDLDALTVDQMQTVFELYATHAIEARLCNDIGTNAIVLPASAQAVANVEMQLRDFIKNGVADALAKAGDALQALTRENVLGFVDEVYQDAFRILLALAEAEDDKDDDE
jgi:hypothetical protein